MSDGVAPILLKVSVGQVGAMPKFVLLEQSSIAHELAKIIIVSLEVQPFSSESVTWKEMVWVMVSVREGLVSPSFQR